MLEAILLGVQWTVVIGMGVGGVVAVVRGLL